MAFSALAAARSSLTRCFSSFSSALACSPARLAFRTLGDRRSCGRQLATELGERGAGHDQGADHGETQIDQRRAGRRDDLRHGVGPDRADEPAGVGDPSYVVITRHGDVAYRREHARVATHEREQTQRAQRHDHEADEHTHAFLGRPVAQQCDAPTEADQREQHRCQTERGVQQPRERFAHGPGRVEPHGEHSETGEHHEPDPERVSSEGRQDLEGGRPLGLLLGVRSPGGRPLGSALLAAWTGGRTRRRTPRRGSLRRHEDS